MMFSAVRAQVQLKHAGMAALGFQVVAQLLLMMEGGAPLQPCQTIP